MQAPNIIKTVAERETWADNSTNDGQIAVAESSSVGVVFFFTEKGISQL